VMDMMTRSLRRASTLLPLGQAGLDLGDGHDDQVPESGQYTLLHLAVVQNAAIFKYKNHSAK
jgi:hypothetical protein